MHRSSWPWMRLSKASLSKIMPVLSRNKLILAHAFLYTSDMTDSIEHNNIVALRTKEGESNYWTVNKKAFNQGRRIP